MLTRNGGENQVLFLSMILSENRFPSRIKCGTGFFRDHAASGPPSPRSIGPAHRPRQAYSSVASSVIVALSTFETGQFAFAVSASLVNSSFDRPGTLALSVSATAAIFQPPSTCSSDTSALVSSFSGGLPAPLS